MHHGMAADLRSQHPAVERAHAEVVDIVDEALHAAPGHDLVDHDRWPAEEFPQRRRAQSRRLAAT